MCDLCLICVGFIWEEDVYPDHSLKAFKADISNLADSQLLIMLHLFQAILHKTQFHYKKLG